MKVWSSCLDLCGAYLLRHSEATVFQIEREECNIPISIVRLLATWLAVQPFIQMVTMSASRSEGSGFIPQSSSFTLCKGYYIIINTYFIIFFSNQLRHLLIRDYFMT